MTSANLSSLCRVCLKEGAQYQIFDDVIKGHCIYTKLSECFKEKLEDIEEYPRNICSTCNDKLDMVYEFITMYKQSQKFLAGRPTSVEQASEYCNLQINYFTRKPDYNCETFQHGKPIKLECSESFEASDSDNDCDKTNILNELQKENLGIIIKETFSIKKDPVIILESLSHLTVKKIKVDNGLESQETNSDINEKKNYKRNNPHRGTLETKKKVLKTKESQQSKTPVKPSKPSKGINHEELRLKKIKLLREIEENKKRTYLIKDHTTKLCDLCGDTFPSANLLSKHKKQKHAERNFKCSQCPKDYRCERDLEGHIARQHDNIRTAICDLCGKAYFTKKHLRQHVAVIHENRKRRSQPSIRKCQYCDKTYTNKRGVLIHERSMHTGERPAKCTVCDSAFYDRVYLSEHMRIHTGHAPYKCPVCQKGFTQRGNMKSHMRNHKISELDEETKSKIKPNLFKFMRP